MRVIGKYGKAIILAVTMAILMPLASHGEDQGAAAAISATGILKKQGITSYMYGTHVLRDDAVHKLYALRSSKVDLDKYLGEKVTVKGSLVPGYPVEGGPDFLEVNSVQAQ